MTTKRMPFEQLRLEAAAYQDWEIKSSDLGYHMFIKYLEVRGWMEAEYEARLLEFIDTNWEEKDN
jgi:hypothetical protein